MHPLPCLSLILSLLPLLSFAHRSHRSSSLSRSPSSAFSSLPLLHSPPSLVLAQRRLKREILEPLLSRESLDRRERRILRKKKQRLIELREQIREMNRVEGGGRGNGTSTRRGSRGHRWRKKVLSKMRMIIDRLDRLEKQTREWSGGEGVMQSTTLSSSRPSITVRYPKSKAGRKFKQFASVAASLNGENGTACASHKDCRPGRCCHRSSPLVSPLCIPHTLSAGSPCADSCQCAAQLHCYAPADNSTSPTCKRAASTDVRTGRYLNTPSGLFTIAPSFPSLPSPSSPSTRPFPSSSPSPTRALTSTTPASRNPTIPSPISSKHTTSVHG